MTEYNGQNISVLFSFPNDKISKNERAKLADIFAQILKVNVLVCDKDCDIAIIKHSKGTITEAENDRD